MQLSGSAGAPRRLPLLFLALTLIPALALGWLTFQLVAREHALEAQRPRDRAEQAADRIVAASHQRLSELEREVLRLATTQHRQPPDHTLVVIAEAESITVLPAAGLLYYPVLPKADLPPRGVFDTGERLEYQQGSPQQAIEVFQKLAHSTDTATRRGALLRLARNQAKARRFDAALATYDELRTLGASMVDGYPAALLALAGRCSILENLGRRTELTMGAKALHAGLTSGGWSLLRDAHEFYRKEAQRWTGEPLETDSERDARALAAAVQSTYATWASGATIPQRRWAIAEGRPVLIANVVTPTRLVTLVGGANYLNESWKAVRDADVLLRDGEGHAILGTPRAGDAARAVRTTDATQLPWTISVWLPASAEDANDALARRNALFGGVAMVLLLLGGSAYVTWRGVTRELAVARLQSDFVSSVSHEFRTPLASIRHLSDMLSSGRVADDTQRQQCYDFLSRESERLEGLVEELLDFGRFEGGAYGYRFEHVNATDLLRDLVATFQDKVAEKGYRVELSVEPSDALVLADRQALSRAIWNLLDNAVKYSPDSNTIWVSLAREESSVVIQVRDRGLGIPSSEQDEIFRKFVRGSNTGVHQIKGTGIGLAMVRHIVEAHHGEIRVDSAPNQGSTFALLLPIERTS